MTFLTRVTVVLVIASSLATTVAQQASPPASPGGIRLRPPEWAQPMLGASVDNFFRVSDELYRSEQPEDRAMKELAAFGLKSILNLRQYHSDKDEAKGTAIALYHVEMNAGEIRPAEIRQVMDIIRKAEKPVLVHCWHGSDRTGVVVAMYRMLFQDWSREKAIDELENGGYGYHKSVYPNIREFLKNVKLEDYR